MKLSPKWSEQLQKNLKSGAIYNGECELRASVKSVQKQNWPWLRFEPIWECTFQKHRPIFFGKLVARRQYGHFYIGALSSVRNTKQWRKAKNVLPDGHCVLHLQCTAVLRELFSLSLQIGFTVTCNIWNGEKWFAALKGRWMCELQAKLKENEHIQKDEEIYFQAEKNYEQSHQGR